MCMSRMIIADLEEGNRASVGTVDGGTEGAVEKDGGT